MGAYFLVVNPAKRQYLGSLLGEARYASTAPR